MTVAGPSRLGPLNKPPIIGKAKRTNIYWPAVTSTESSRTLNDDHDSLYEEIVMEQQQPINKGKAPATEQSRAPPMSLEKDAPSQSRELSPGSRRQLDQAKRTHNKRDRDDGDWTPPEKRPRILQSEVRPGRPAVVVANVAAEPKTDRVQHKRYDTLTEKGKHERRTYVNHINALLNMTPEDWKHLPGAPKSKALFNGHSIRHPRDWNTPTLRTLCELVQWIDADFEKVKSLISQAFKKHKVTVMFLRAGSPVLCAQVIDVAAEILRKSTTNNGNRKPAGNISMGRNDKTLGRQSAPSPTPGPSNSQPTPPHSPRSATLAPNYAERPTKPGAPTVPNMVESSLVVASPRPSAVLDGERNAYVARCMEQLAYLDDEDDYFKKKREANEAERRCLGRILRNAGRVGAHGLLIGQA